MEQKEPTKPNIKENIGLDQESQYIEAPIINSDNQIQVEDIPFREFLFIEGGGFKIQLGSNTQSIQELVGLSEWIEKNILNPQKPKPNPTYT